MEILVLSFIGACSYLLILSKVFSLSFVIKTQVIWDVIFTIGIPVLLLGTFSGMATAFLSGFFFTVLTGALTVLNPPANSNKRIKI
jgi:hypothetical protein